MNAGTQAVVADFEYRPFGEEIRASGEFADELTFRFSTKYEDSEIGYLYYGYRYYDADRGRWLNRDPIGEDGGRNLMEMVNNNPVCLWDVLELDHLDSGDVEGFLLWWRENNTIDDAYYVGEFYDVHRQFYDGIQGTNGKIDAGVELTALVTAMIENGNRQGLENLAEFFGEKLVEKVVDKATKGNPVLGFVFDASTGGATAASALIADHLENANAHALWSRCWEAYTMHPGFLNNYEGPFEATYGRFGKIDCYSRGCKIYAKTVIRDEPTLYDDSLAKSVVKIIFNNTRILWYTED